MDTLFRSKHRGRNSASSTSTSLPSPTDLTASVPYNQIPTSHPPPIAGPSTSFARGISVNDVGAPSTNPSLGIDGQAFNLHRPAPPSPRRSEKSRTSTRNSSSTDVDRVDSPDLTRNGTRSSNRQQPMAEFGGPRHPYAAARDTDNMSIRTVSSIGSNRDMAPVRDLGRYPSFATDPRGSVSSRSTHTLVTPRSNYAPSNPRLSEEYSFARPPDYEIDRMFEELISTRNVDSIGPSTSRSSVSSTNTQANLAKTTATMSVEVKWQMVESDHRARWDAAKMRQRKEEELLRSGKASKRATTVVKNSPEWFLKKCLDGTLTADHVRTLSVSIRTQPYEWVMP